METIAGITTDKLGRKTYSSLSEVTFFPEEDKGFDAIDFVSGIIAGFVITVVGHPFDTIKVRLQTTDIIKIGKSAPFKGGYECARSTLRKEGITGFYRGMASPLATVPAINAIVFAAYEQGIRVLKKPDVDKPSMTTRALAGAWAGAVNSLVVTPVELIKSRLQVQYVGQGNLRGPIDTIRETIRAHGISGLYTGMNITVLREIPAYMAQFYYYEYTKKLCGKYFNEDPLDPSAYTLMFSGAVGGLSAWLYSYPQDVIKSRLQTQDPHPNKQIFLKHKYIPDGGAISCAKHIYRHSGLRGFTVGFGPCALRAIPANAAGFFAYEKTSQFMKAYIVDEDEL